MEPITITAMISYVVGFLAKKLKDNKSVQDFFSDFTEATVNWIKPIFITEDEKPKEIIQDLQADPADELNTAAVENALAKALKRNPEAEADLKAMYDSLQAKASRGESISIVNSKNVNTGNINAGGNMIIGDNESSKFTEYYEKNVVECDSIKDGDNINLGDSHSHNLGYASEEKGAYQIVEVYYATDRNLINSGTGRIFGDLRSEFDKSSKSFLKYGICNVSIPYKHKVGFLEAPSIWKFEFSENPNKHISVLNVTLKLKQNFFADINASLQKDLRKRAFVFIHGYNVKFMDAARRAAQIHYDLKFEGIPLFYSWPSTGRTMGYTVDEATIEWSQANLELFIEELLQSSPIDDLYLIGHSMGNRALTRAVISLLNKEHKYRTRIKGIILAAPDIDADVFLRDIAPEFAKHSQSVTLYASSRDRALVASRKVHGYPRAGESGKKLIIASGVETIDATNANTSFLGHSYFSNTRTILSDIFHIVSSGLMASQRFGLDAITNTTGKYWKIRK